MKRLHTQTALEACINNDLDTLQHTVPSLLNANSRADNFRIGDRPYSTVPFLCVCAAYGNLECFNYLIEKGGTSYYADLIFSLILFILIFFGNFFSNNAPIHFACRYGKLDILKRLIELHEDVNCENVTFTIFH